MFDDYGTSNNTAVKLGSRDRLKLRKAHTFTGGEWYIHANRARVACSYIERDACNRVIREEL